MECSAVVEIWKRRDFYTPKSDPGVILDYGDSLTD